MPKPKTLMQRELRRQYAREHKENPRLPLFRHRSDAPRTRSECEVMSRPCPFVGCRYHLFAHVFGQGNVQLPYGEDPSAIKTMTETCTLDVAADGPHSQYRVSRLLNLTQAAVSKLEIRALAKVAAYIAKHGGGDEDTS